MKTSLIISREAQVAVSEFVAERKIAFYTAMNDLLHLGIASWKLWGAGHRHQWNERHTVEAGARQDWEECLICGSRK